MSRFFTDTFFRFFLGFAAIITVAFVILLGASALLPEKSEIHNVASPQE